MDPQWHDSAADEEDQYHLRLYVTGASANSVRAIANINAICEKHLAGKYTLEIIDVHQEGELAQKAQIVALPMMVKYFPLPERRLIGDMSDSQRVLRALNINPNTTND